MSDDGGGYSDDYGGDEEREEGLSNRLSDAESESPSEEEDLEEVQMQN